MAQPQTQRTQSRAVRQHAISGNAKSGSLTQQLTQLMAELQFREITPEDYDLLLELDASIKPRYVER